MKAWNIKQLYTAMLDDLKLCQTDLERSMSMTINKKEIREFAKNLNRKLTPIEQSILDNL
tara:strand:+ start:154 stop:333 length:180 start_codon:yes stop_codon:yes gene_type:complete